MEKSRPILRVQKIPIAAKDQKFKCRLCETEVKVVEVTGEKWGPMTTLIYYVCPNKTCTHFRVQRSREQVDLIR